MGDQTRKGNSNGTNNLVLGADVDKLVGKHGLSALREEVLSKFNNTLVYIYNAHKIDY